MESLPTFKSPRIDKAMMDELESYIDEGMNDYVMSIRNALRKKWDKIIVVTGRKGVAKSTFAILLAKLIDYDFTFDRLAFTPIDIIPIFQKMPTFSSMIVDEGAEVLYRGDYASKISKTIIKQTVGDRWLYSARFWIAPSIFNIDKSLIPLMDYWIKVYCPDGETRGYAEIRTMTERDYTNEKIPYAPAIYDVRFDDLPPDVAQLYERYKAEQGSKRTAEYQKLIERESGSQDENLFKAPDFDVVEEEIIKKIDEFLSPRTDMVDWRLVYRAFKPKNLSQEGAKTVANTLNKLRESGFKP